MGDKGLFPNAFCKIVPDLFGKDPTQAVVMHADGAGTKSSLAYMYWKTTGDLSVWNGIAQDSIVMNLDDLLCVGVTNDIGLSSTIGRNKNLIPGEVVAATISGTNDFVAKMREHGVGITRTYAPVIHKVFASGLRQHIHGMVHCSGGGQTKVLHFVEGVHVVKDNMFKTPSVFHVIQKSSGTAWAEMYKVFNMGHRMEIYTDQATA